MPVNRVVTRNKEDLHLSIMVDGSREDFEKVVKGIRESINKHNNRSDNKVSYDIIFHPSPKTWKEKTQGNSYSFQIPLSGFLRNSSHPQK